MTVASTTSWNPAVTDIVRKALINVGAIDETEQPTAAQYADGVFSLNGIVKTAEATGLHVWAEEEGVLFLQTGQAKYVIGNPNPALNAHTADADNWVERTLTTNAAASATTISLNATAGLSSGDNVGVILNDGTTFWTTASGAPSGLNVTLAAAIPSVAASAGAFVLTYPASGEIGRPLKVPNARVLQLQGLIKTPMTVMSRQEYEDLPNALSPGTPTQWFYSPRRDQGLLYVWPVPNTTAWAVRFTWYRALADLLTPNNTLDFPQEWVLPLQWWLSEELALSAYPVSAERFDRIKAKAAEYRELAEGYDRESEPVQFGLDYRYR